MDYFNNEENYNLLITSLNLSNYYLNRYNSIDKSKIILYLKKDFELKKIYKNVFIENKQLKEITNYYILFFPIYLDRKLIYELLKINNEYLNFLFCLIKE